MAFLQRKSAWKQAFLSERSSHIFIAKTPSIIASSAARSSKRKTRKSVSAPTSAVWAGGVLIGRNRRKRRHRFVRYVSRNLSHIQVSVKSTAPSRVQERQGGRMNRNVMMYQVMVDILKNWLKSGVISQKDYRAMHTTMAEKYGVSLSGIFVDNFSVTS